MGSADTAVVVVPFERSESKASVACGANGLWTFSMNSTNSLATTTLELITMNQAFRRQSALTMVNNSLVAFLLIETIEHDVETISPMTHS